MLSEIDQKLLKIAYEEAKEGFEEGGCPIGSVLARDGKIIAQGKKSKSTKRRSNKHMVKWMLYEKRADKKLIEILCYILA